MMQTLRRSRTLARLLAAWVLLWFGAMLLSPFVDAAAAAQACAAGAAHAGHEGHPGHRDAACNEKADDVLHAGHAGHGNGSLAHCPVCMQAAAPPPAAVAHATAGVQPAGPRAAPVRAQVRVRTDVPPPARAPPLFS